MKSSTTNPIRPSPENRVDPYSAWKTYEDREIVLILRDYPILIDSHPKGIIRRVGSSLFLNNDPDPLLTDLDPFDVSCFGHAMGFIIRRGNRFLINDTLLVYEGTPDSWRAHPQGLVVEKDGTFLLNGNREMWRGECDEWDACLKGIITEHDNRIVLNGSTVLYEGAFDAWFSHPQGAIIQYRDMLILNNERVIYEGSFDTWHRHPHGIIINKKSLLFFVRI